MDARGAESSLGFDPAAVGFDEVTSSSTPLLRDARLDDLPAAVEGDQPAALADVAVVRVRHLAGAVDDAAHHRDVQPLQVAGGVAYLVEDGGQIELRAAAAGAGDELDLRPAQAERLQDLVADGELVDRVFGQRDADRVADPLRRAAWRCRRWT